MTVAEAAASRDITACVEEYKKTISALIQAKRDDKADAIANLTTAGLAQLVEVRAKYVKLCILTEASSHTDKERRELETASVQLQTRQFTQSWLERLISSNLAFASAYTDADLALRPVGEVEASLTDAERASLADAADSEHARMLMRLSREREERQTLKKQLEDLQSTKATLQADNERKRRRLTKMVDQVAALTRTAAPTLTDLGLPHAATAARHPSALSRLPLPLYVLHSQLMAANEAHDLGLKISLAKEGTGKGKASTKGASSAGEAGDERVLVDLPRASDGTGGVAVYFAYAPCVRTVTAAARDPHQTRILDSLYPADSGSTLPHNVGPAAQADSPRSPASLLSPLAGKPYKWCQHLSGLDLLMPPPHGVDLAADLSLSDPAAQLAAYRTERRAAAFVARLRQRLGDAALLKCHLDRLAKRLMPEGRARGADASPTCPSASVVAWKVLRSIVTTSAPDASAAAAADEDGELDDEAPARDAQDAPPAPASEEQLTGLYTCTLQAGPADAPVRVDFECQVGMFYPGTPPLLRVLSAKGGASAPGGAALPLDMIASLQAVASASVPEVAAADPLPAAFHALALAAEALAQPVRESSTAGAGDAAPMDT